MLPQYMQNTVFIHIALASSSLDDVCRLCFVCGNIRRQGVGRGCILPTPADMAGQNRCALVKRNFSRFVDSFSAMSAGLIKYILSAYKLCLTWNTYVTHNSVFDKGKSRQCALICSKGQCFDSEPALCHIIRLIIIRIY